MTSNAHVFGSGFVSVPGRRRSPRRLLGTLCETVFWLGIVGWWVVIAVGVVRAWLAG